EEMLRQMMVALLAGGHALLEGVPGTAKTLAIRSLSLATDLRFGRVQFTPDLMPTDLVGVNILDETRKEFVYHPGPIFADLLLADEINRAPAKTQAALLEAMQERQVTVDGVSRPLPAGFTVFASQNPVEYEGTYPLPEAQLDRFLLEIDVGYPTRDAERRILIETTGADEHKPLAVMNAEALMNAQRLVRRLPVGESVVDAILDLVRSARPEGDGIDGVTDKILWGPGPRASQALMLAVRARALIEGRVAPSIADVVALAEPVLKHRMALTFSARADGESIRSVIGRLTSRLAG
ncbi:MAG: AAA family ATPase, partial [Microvirga sp.]